MAGLGEEAIVAAAEKLIAALTYDDSGFQGKGGNGGLISRETIREADMLRIAIARWKRSRESVARIEQI